MSDHTSICSQCAGPVSPPVHWATLADRVVCSWDCAISARKMLVLTGHRCTQVLSQIRNLPYYTVVNLDKEVDPVGPADEQVQAYRHEYLQSIGVAFKILSPQGP